MSFTWHGPSLLNHYFRSAPGLIHRYSHVSFYGNRASCARGRGTYLFFHILAHRPLSFVVFNPQPTIIIVLFVIRFNYLVTFLLSLQNALSAFHRKHLRISKNPLHLIFKSEKLFPDYFASFGLLAPYLERACLLLATPAVSSVPLTIWYLVPGRSLTLPPRIKTTLCS